MASTNEPLNAPQLNALYDILTHAETFNEIRGLRYESSITRFGPPLTQPNPGHAPLPMIQMIMSKFVGKGLYSDQGWADWITVVERLCAANLSDSYDKGFMGLRKHLACGLAAALESVARGLMAGAPKNPEIDFSTLSTKQYDRRSASQLEKAWDDAVQGMLYGDLLDRVFDAVKASPNIDDVPPVARAALDYFLATAATMMHYMFVLVPEGQQLVKMMDTIDTLTPYSIIKQTLKMTNVQAMLNGILKIALAKVGDKNLVQTMVSRTIKLDLHDLEKRAEKIKKKGKDGKGAPKELFVALDDYVRQPRSHQESCRTRSQQERKSIVAVIVETYYPAYPPQGVQNLNDDQHGLALEYLSIQLSIRDRLEGVQAICKDKPDVLSPLVKEQMGLITPILKAAHDGKFDISQVIPLQKALMEDMIKTAKMTPKHIPGVDDFYAMLQRNIALIWKVLNDGAVHCPSLHQATYKWCRASLNEFRSSNAFSGQLRTGAMTQALTDMFESLPAEQKQAVRSTLDDHSAYMMNIRTTSTANLRDVLAKKCEPDQIGPGPALPRWHALLDAQLLTPAGWSGRVRTGQEVNQGGAQQNVAVAPDASPVVGALGMAFRNFLASDKANSLYHMGDMKANLPHMSVSESRGGYAVPAA